MSFFSFLGSHLVGMTSSLASNFAVVVSALLFYMLLLERRIEHKGWRWQLWVGLAFGVMTIISMISPIRVREGVIIDAKYVLTVISTCYGGWLAGLLTALISGSTRFMLGGMGFYAAAPTLVASWLLGLVFAKYAHPQEASWRRVLEFFALGVMLWVLQLLGGLMFLLFQPWSYVGPLLIDRSLPAALIFPPMTVLLGMSLDFIDSRKRLVDQKKVLEQRSLEEKARFVQSLEARNQELQAINYALHHDLRTPLVTIQSYLGEVRRGLEAGESSEVLDDIARVESAIHKLSSLLRDMSLLNSAGSPPPPQSHCEVQPLLEQILKKYAYAQVETCEPLVVACEGRRLAKIMDILLQNALKFQRAGIPLRVHIRIVREGNMVVFSIQDNGIGISPNFVDSVFQLFERLDVKMEGNGIGLTLVRRLVQACSGRAWAESEGDNTGATFYFTLPLVSAVSEGQLRIQES